MPYAIYTVESKEPSYLTVNSFVTTPTPFVDMRFITTARDPSGVMADLVNYIGSELDNNLRDSFDEPREIDNVGELTTTVHSQFATITSILEGIKLTPVYILNDAEEDMVSRAIGILAYYDATRQAPVAVDRQVYGGKIRDLRRAMLVRLSNSSLNNSEGANKDLFNAIQQLRNP